MPKSSIWPTGRILSVANTPNQSRPGSDGNEGVLPITGTSPSDCLMLYQDTRWGGLTEMHSVYCTAPVDWAKVDYVCLCLKCVKTDRHKYWDVERCNLVGKTTFKFVSFLSYYDFIANPKLVRKNRSGANYS